MFDPPGGMVSSTPMPGRTMGGENRSWEDSMESPFDRMDRKLRDELRLDQGYAESDMPTPSLPSGYSLQALDNVDRSYDFSTGTVEPVDIPRHQSVPQQPAPANTAPGAGAGGDTPKAKKTEHTRWNGVTDLRTTPLNAKFAKPAKASVRPPKPSLANTMAELSMDDSEDDIKMTMSPPVTMTFTLPPRAQAVFNTSRTPVKQAASTVSSNSKKDGEARMILDDLMEEMGNEDSPHMPTPEAFGRYSVVPEELGPGRRLFGNDEQDTAPGPSRLGTSRRSLANTSYGSDILDQSVHPTPIYDNPDADDSFEDQDDSFDSGYGATIQQQPQSSYSQHSHVPPDDETYGDITVSSVGDISEAGKIFGGGGPSQGGSGGQFNLMRQEEIDTFFGGKLEDAAGRDVRLSPTYAHGHR